MNTRKDIENEVALELDLKGQIEGHQIWLLVLGYFRKQVQ